METKNFNIKCRYYEKLSDYEEKKAARKITRKNMKAIDGYKTQINKTSESKIEIIENTSSKLMSGLYLEKGFKIKRIRKIEIKLEKLK